MDKGIIATDYFKNVVVIVEFIGDEGQRMYQELPIHPYFKNKTDFVLGEEVEFQYANECTIHYPSYCDCYKKKTYALIMPKEKLTLFKRLKNKFRL